MQRCHRRYCLRDFTLRRNWCDIRGKLSLSLKSSIKVRVTSHIWTFFQIFGQFQFQLPLHAHLSKNQNLQWGFKYLTSPVFVWSKVIRLLYGSVFECIWNIGLAFKYKAGIWTIIGIAYSNFNNRHLLICNIIQLDLICVNLNIDFLFIKSGLGWPKSPFF